MQTNARFQVLKALSGGVLAMVLSGCSANFVPAAVEPEMVPIGNIQGTVHGGQAAVSGAQIYLFAASTTAYGSNAKSLITSGGSGVSCNAASGNSNSALNSACYVTTDSNGNFALGGDYTCTAGQQVYMVAIGGNPGITPGTISTTATFSSGSSTLTVASATGINIGMTATGTGVGGTVTGVSGTTVTLSRQTTSAGTGASVQFSGVNNTAIVQMAGLAQCPAAGNLAAQVPYLVINEVTTVAFAYSMSGFATTAFNVSTDATGATAIANAMANAGNIVNLQWGQAPTVANGNPNSINPQSKIYALANMLAACVNTSNIQSTYCKDLLTDAKANGTTGTAASDEASAIFNIVHNQASSFGTLWNDLGTSTPVFTPTLASAPTDWTMPVIYTGLVSLPNTSQTPPTYTSGPFNIAFDASGNGWIGDRQKGVVKVAPQGAATTYNSNGTGSFTMVKGVAVSPIDGTIWVSDYGANAVYVMNSAGSIMSTINNTSLSGNATVSGPILTAFSGTISGRSRVYEATETTTGVIVLDPATYAFDDFETGSNFANVNTPGWISVDQSGTAWIPSTNTTYTGQVSYTEKGKSGNFTYTSAEASGSPNSYSTVVDSSSNVWLAQITGTAQLEKIPSGSTSAQSTVYTGGGLNGPYKLALDGGNNIWIANSNGNTVSGFSATSSSWLATSGFSTSAPGGAGCVVAAPDPSGNVWAANSDGSVTQLLGLSTPTAAPFYGGVSSTSGSTAGNIGTKP